MLGDGRRSLFWWDKWAGNVCLKEVFPRLFTLSIDTMGVVDAYYQRRVGPVDWNLGFRRVLLAWEEEVSRLYDFLRIAPDSCSSQSDTLSWIAGPSSSFTVSSAYNWWDSSLRLTLSCTNILRNNCAPSKAQFFGWLSWHGKVKTASFLCRIGVLGSNVNQACIFCNIEVESVNHILLFCPFVWLIWSNIVRWWGL